MKRKRISYQQAEALKNVRDTGNFGLHDKWATKQSLTGVNSLLPSWQGKVILCDALDGLRALATGSVDLVFSDLPSGATAAPTDQAPDLQALFAATWRALKPTGVAVFMASDLRFAAQLVAASPLLFRYDLVWEKSAATGFLNAKRRPMRAHEHLLVFWREPGTYNPQETTGHSPMHAVVTPRLGKTQNYGAPGAHATPGGSTTRRPRSVLRIASLGTSSKLRVHHQQKPAALCEWVIRTYSNEGDLVVDPYAGSGVAVDTAERLGRRALGFDSDPAYGLAQTGEHIVTTAKYVRGREEGAADALAARRTTPAKAEKGKA